MYRFLFIFMFCIIEMLGATEKNENLLGQPNGYSMMEEYSFSRGTEGWIGGFSDYPVTEESFYELAWGWENLPNPIDGWTKGIYLSGNNHSDDLFMFIKHPFQGLEPGAEYKVSLFVTIENNVGVGGIGVGGSPGESVYAKIGASTDEPESVNTNGQYVLNLDKGNQGVGGVNADVVGDLANPAVNVEDPTYEVKEFHNSDNPITVKADKTGRIWLLFGTDSGFEATTKYYIVHVKVFVQPI